MAIFTVTSGAQSDLAVVKISPVIQDCFTLYEYVVNTNQGDDIDITLTGNHYEASYINNNVETDFTDTASGITFNTTLRVKFLLLNSGTTGVFSSATIRIDNNTTGYYYENFVEREDDSANCYESGTIPTKTSDLLNDGHDGTNPFVDTLDIANFVTTNTTQTITGAKTFEGGLITDDDLAFVKRTGNVVNAVHGLLYFKDDDTLGISVGTGQASDNLTLDGINAFTAARTVTFPDKDGTMAMLSDLTTDADNIVFDSYLTITASDVQAAIEELKDEVDAIGGVITVDSTITNGSTNPVENDAIYDEFQLVSYLGSSNSFSGATNTFTQELVIHDTTDGLQLSNDGSENRIDTNAHALHIFGNSNPAGGWTFQTDSGLIGSSSSYIYTPYITVDNDAYSSGWNGSTRVPTKDAIYDKIESLTGGDVTESGTAADDQVAVWTASGSIEGTSNFTYDGSNLQITGDIGSTGTRITKGWFTDLEVSNAIVGDITGESATVTSIGNLTGDVTSVNRATTISAGAVDIPMLSASGTPSATTFLRGDNTWATPAGSGDVSKVGTPVNNEIGVWTGDGTIEGDTNFQWNGTNLLVNGGIIIDGPANSFTLTGTNTGSSNQGWFTITDSLSVIRARIGFTSSTDADLSFENLETNQELRLDGSAGTSGLKFYDSSSEYSVWHQGNDGSGSGLDADTLDGVQGSSYLRSDADDTFTGSVLYIDDDTFLRFGVTGDQSNISWDSGQGATIWRMGNDTDLWFRDLNSGVDRFKFDISNGELTIDSLTGGTSSLLQANSSGVISRVGAGYETGSWTASLVGSTSGTYTIGAQACNYVKIGKMVFFQANLANISGTAPVGSMEITGLPHSSNSVTSVACTMTGLSNQSFYSVVGSVATNKIQFYRQSGLDGSALELMTDVNFTGSTGQIIVSGTFMTV